MRLLYKVFFYLTSLNTQWCVSVQFANDNLKTLSYQRLYVVGKVFCIERGKEGAKNLFPIICNRI